jgi:hypothetical protein
MGISILAWLSSRDSVSGQYGLRGDNQANMEMPITQSESGTEVLQMQAECKYKFVHIELVI